MKSLDHVVKRKIVEAWKMWLLPCFLVLKEQFRMMRYVYVLKVHCALQHLAFKLGQTVMTKESR